MKNAMLLLMAIILAFTTSCNKKNETDPQPIPTPDFTQLAVGNYWIFQGFDLDSNGVATPTDDWDSAFISKDTLINGFTYYKMHEKGVIYSSQQQIIYLRDSMDYLVNQFGQILFAQNNFADTLYQDTAAPGLFYSITMMCGKDSTVVVPAGTFTTRTLQSTIVPLQPVGPVPVRYCYTIYGEGVGKIKTHNFFYASDKHFEKRLIRYRVGGS